MNDPTIINIDKLSLVNIRDEQHNTVASFYGQPIMYNVRSITNGSMQIEVCFNVQTKNFSMHRLDDAILAGANRDIDEDIDEDKFEKNLNELMENFKNKQ